MQASRCLVFDAFRLDLHDEWLWRGQEVIHLRPKTFAVLCCLATQAGQLVTKDALLVAVWPETVVSESVVPVAIRELRRVLDDRARTPQFIETVHGRGYRFIAPVSATTSAEEPVLVEVSRRSQPSSVSRPRLFVGRAPELAQLTQWWTTMRQGQRQIGFIVGEPGIGKTAIVHTHPLRPLMADSGSTRSVPNWCWTIYLKQPSRRICGSASRRCSFPPGLPQLLHQRTSGNALFLVTLVDELARQQILESGPEAWDIRGGLEAVTGIIPVGLRQFIEAHVERLPGPDQALLEAASVVGSTFSVAAVAAGASLSEEAIDARCAAWARHGQFLDATGTETWPDGTVAACYRFRHTLYQEMVYARVSAGLQLRLHHQIGARKEAGYGDQASTIAAELAVHFERAQEVDRAVRYLRHAVDHAMQRSAYADVIRHCTKGLELLAALPSTPERTQQALALHLPFAQALAVRKGWAAPEVEQVFNRARELGQQMADNPQLYPMLGGLTAFYMFRGQLHTAWEIGQQYFALVQHADDPARRLHVHALLGELLDSFGEFAAARAHFEQAMTLHNLQRPDDRRALHDAGVAPCALLAPVLWTLGYPEQALARSQEARALLQALV